MTGFDQMAVEALLNELKGIRKALADMSQEVTTIRREIAGAGGGKTRDRTNASRYQHGRSSVGGGAGLTAAPGGMPLFLSPYRLNRKGGVAPLGALERLGNVAETAGAGVLPVGAASAGLDCPPSKVAARPVVAGRPVTEEPLTAAGVIHGHQFTRAWEPHSHGHGHGL